MQQAMLDIKKKFGKNAILKGMNLEEGATARDRNNQIGGTQGMKNSYDDIINLPHQFPPAIHRCPSQTGRPSFPLSPL